MKDKDSDRKWLTTQQKADEEHLSTKQVLRRAKKKLYPGAYQLSPGGEWRFPANQPLAEPQKVLTPAEIALEEAYRTAVLAHFEDLRKIAAQWKSQLWLPPPWQWDITDLRQVYYEDENKERTGYKLPQELANGEKSRGYFRLFADGSVHWSIKKDDGTVMLKSPVESDPGLNYLKDHTTGSPAWYFYTEWKRLGGTYLQYCSSLFGRISQDVQRVVLSESQQLSWIIYHDAFCINDTALRCDRCGGWNDDAKSKFCKSCNLLLGWLQPLGQTLEQASDSSETVSVHIHGWGNVVESLEIGRFEGLTRGINILQEKYRGCDLVEKILEAEKKFKSVNTQLVDAVDTLSKQQAFNGKCKSCPSITEM